MKKTNYQAGPRGINLKGGSTHWVEPGQTVEIGTKKVDGKDVHTVGDVEVQGDLPDFGRKVDADADKAADSQIEALTAENASLRQEVTDLTKKLADAAKK